MKILLLLPLLYFYPSVTVYQKPVTHDNAYYCNIIKQTGEEVVGGSEKEVTKLCKNL
jgi:hypothetical protein